jgi:hypothetical protein
MSNSPALGLGGFLLGLGIGYLIFRDYIIAASNFAWVLIIIGAAVILSGIIRWASPKHGFHRAVGGAAGGLVLALFITQGFAFFGNFGNFGNLPYSATQPKTYGGAVTASTVSLRLGSINGPITVQTWDKGDYQIVATITARGATQAEADQNLANLGKDLTESTSAGAQTLNLVYSSPILINNPYQISVEVKLPISAKLNLDLTTSNGAINIENVSGDTVKAQTSNARIDANNVKASTVTLSTSNAIISGNVEGTTVSASTSNARIDLTVPSTKSGRYDFSTSNADVDVTVGASAACKLDAQTSNGQVNFNLPNLTYSRNQATSKAAETSGYSSAQIQIQVTIRTSNADVTIDRNVFSV